MHPYALAVSAHLARLDAPTRAAAIEDLEALLAEGVDPADLGDPSDYAAGVTGGAAGPEAAPRSWWGWARRADRARVWDPQNPSLLVRRALGAGVRLNAGALAVRLGWLRPDDMDADVVAAIDPRVRLACRAVPAALAAVAAGSAFTAVGRGRPVATHLRLDGRADRRGDPRLLMLPVVVAAGAAAWGAWPADGEEAVTRPALAASTAGTVVLVLAAATGDPAQRRRWLAPALVVAPAVIETILTVLPVRSGVRRVTRGDR